MSGRVKERHDGETSPVGQLNATERVRLKRRIKFYQAIAITAATMIGGAIYITPGDVLKGAGSPVGAVVVWLVAGLLSMLGALTYAELATTYPGSGENLHYLSEFYGPSVSFNYSWMYVIFERPAASAVKAITFGKYLIKLAFPDCALPEVAVKLIAILLAMASGALNTVNVEAANKIHSFVTALSALSLLAFSIIGTVYLGKGKIESWTSDASVASDPTEIVLTLFVALYAYGGWNAPNAMTEEVKNPNKNVPRAIVISTAAVIVLYVMVNVAYITVLGSYHMINSEAVAVSFGLRVFPSVAWVAPIIVSIAQMSSYNSAMVVGTRILFVSARKDFYPSTLTLITTWSLSPVAAIVFQTLLVVIYIASFSVYGLITNTMFVSTLYKSLVLLGLIRDRFKKPQLTRPLKLPIIIPLVYLVLDVLLLIIPLTTKPLTATTGAIVTLGSGIPIYLLFVAGRWRHHRLSSLHNYIMCLVQRIFLCLPEEKQNYQGPEKDG